jgi:hypothetical protein
MDLITYTFDPHRSAERSRRSPQPLSQGEKGVRIRFLFSPWEKGLGDEGSAMYTAVFSQIENTHNSRKPSQKGSCELGRPLLGCDPLYRFCISYLIHDP